MSELSGDDLDLLADLLAGEGTDEQVARVAASPELAQALADLEAASGLVQADLAALPDVSPPDGFAERLTAALDGLATPARSVPSGSPGRSGGGAGSNQDVVPMPGRRRPAPAEAPWLLRSAAGIVALLVLAGAGFLVLRDGGSQDGDPATAAAPRSTVADVPTSQSGRDYRGAGVLQAAVPELLSPPPQAASIPMAGDEAPADTGAEARASARAPSAGRTTSGSGGSTGVAGGAGGAAPEAGAAAALDRLRNPAALQGCLTALELEPGVQPEALDYARYGGRPALVVLLPVAASPTQLDAYVVGPACGQPTEDLIFFGRVDRP